MLANLKIICQFHAHPVHQKSVEIFWAEIYRGRLFFRAESSLIQSNSRSLRNLKSSCAEQKFLSVCQKRFNKLKNINISRTSLQNDFYYTRVPGFSSIGRTREGTRFRITFVLYVKKIFIS